MKRERLKGALLTLLIVSFAGCSPQKAKNPFADVNHLKAFSDCRAEVMKMPGVTSELVEVFMGMQTNALKELSRIEPTPQNREHLKDAFDFSYPNFIAAKAVFDETSGRNKAVGTNSRPALPLPH